MVKIPYTVVISSIIWKFNFG